MNIWYFLTFLDIISFKVRGGIEMSTKTRTLLVILSLLLFLVPVHSTLAHTELELEDTQIVTLPNDDEDYTIFDLPYEH